MTTIRLPTTLITNANQSPEHRWDARTNQNTNGLIRQYLPKKQSMAHLTQHDCNRIATQLNNRPRKRLGYRTPEECYGR